MGCNVGYFCGMHCGLFLWDVKHLMYFSCLLND